MPGHSLYRNKRTHLYYFKHDGGFNAVNDVMPDLHAKFFYLGSKHLPRDYGAGGDGNDIDIKKMLLYEAGILEAMQRWQTNAPRPVYDPSETFDYDQITEMFNQLNIELHKKKNRDGSTSPPYVQQLLPKWNDDHISQKYDDWLTQRATEFRDELIKKPTVKQKSDYVPQNPDGTLGPFADLLGEILDHLSSAKP